MTTRLAALVAAMSLVVLASGVAMAQAETKSERAMTPDAGAKPADKSERAMPTQPPAPGTPPKDKERAMTKEK